MTGDAAQGLHGGKGLDQGVPLGHSLACHGQGQGDRRQEPLRDEGDGDADGEDKIAPEAPPDEEAQGEEEDADEGRDGRHEARRLHDLLLEGAQALIDGAGQVGDPAELGPHARGKDKGLARTARDGRPGKDDVGALQELALGRSVIPEAGLRLAREGRVVHLQESALDEPRIGGNPVALGKEDDITRHDFARGDLLLRSFPDDLHMERQELFQGSEGLLRAVLLDEGKDRIDQDDGDDGHAEGEHALPGVEMVGEERKAGADPQQDRQEVGKLLQKSQDEGCPGGLPDFVESVFRESLGGLPRGKAALGADEGT